MQGVVYNIRRLSTEDGPGYRTAVFLKGCPLHCPWCSAPQSQCPDPQLLVYPSLCTRCGACAGVCPADAVIRLADGSFGRDPARCTNCGACVAACPARARVMTGRSMSVEDVVRTLDCDHLFYVDSGGGVTIGGGEPLLAGDFLLELLQATRRRGYHVCLKTGGLGDPAFFRELTGLVDLFLFDCKVMDSDLHRELTGCGNETVLENLAMLLDTGQGVRIRVPWLAGINDTMDNIAALSLFLHDHDRTVVDLLPCPAPDPAIYAALDRPAPQPLPCREKDLELVLDRFARRHLHVDVIS